MTEDIKYNESSNIKKDRRRKNPLYNEEGWTHEYSNAIKEYGKGIERMFREKRKSLLERGNKAIAGITALAMGAFYYPEIGHTNERRNIDALLKNDLAREQVIDNKNSISALFSFKFGKSGGYNINEKDEKSKLEGILGFLPVEKIINSSSISYRNSNGLGLTIDTEKLGIIENASANYVDENTDYKWENLSPASKTAIIVAALTFSGLAVYAIKKSLDDDGDTTIEDPFTGGDF